MPFFSPLGRQADALPQGTDLKRGDLHAPTNRVVLTWKWIENAFSEVFMIPLFTAVSSGFTFKTNWQGFELQQDGQTVATLKRPRVWSSEFIAATTSESWIIRRGGFWGNKGEIRDAASQQEIAAFKWGWGGKGSLLFADGQVFFVLTRGCWHPVWTVTTEAGQPVLQLHTREKSVEVHERIPLAAERLSLLVLFTLYRVQQAEEAAAAAAAVAS
jgi:hypothetical protein